MSDNHRLQYYTEVKCEGRAPSMERISSAFLPVWFSLYMPHQDPKLLEPERSLEVPLHREELQLILDHVRATAFKRIGDHVDHLLKEYLFSLAFSEINEYQSWDKWLELKKTWMMAVLKILMPLAEEKHHRDIVSKIFDVLATMPEDTILIYVNIYVVNFVPNPKPATMLAMVNRLERVRLDRSCGICMDDFEKGVTAIRLPCLHMFHETCIFRWLENHYKCPLCRHPMPHDDADMSSDKPDDEVIVYQNSYYTKNESKTCTMVPSSMLQIQFNLYKSHKFCRILTNGIVVRTSMPDDEKTHLQSEPLLLRIPSSCELQPTMITQVLRSMSVPRAEHPAIVAKIFETFVATNNADIGGVFINTNIYHETLKLFDLRAFRRWQFRFRRIGIDRPIADEIDAMVARELAEEESYGKARPEPATKSAIEGLERVRVDTSCAICMGDFEDGLLATRFPCLHIFHGDCILRWLETHYKCPLCQYPLFSE